MPSLPAFIHKQCFYGHFPDTSGLAGSPIDCRFLLVPALSIPSGHARTLYVSLHTFRPRLHKVAVVQTTGSLSRSLSLRLCHVSFDVISIVFKISIHVCILRPTKSPASHGRLPRFGAISRSPAASLISPASLALNLFS